MTDYTDSSGATITVDNDKMGNVHTTNALLIEILTVLESILDSYQT